jgi:hypothetical protein
MAAEQHARSAWMKAKDRETAALRHASWTNNEETVNAAMELEAGEETLGRKGNCRFGGGQDL